MAATVTCDRCGGRGGWEGWPGFTCYKCGGSGTIAATRKAKGARPIPNGTTKIVNYPDQHTNVYHTDCGWHRLGDPNCRCGNFVLEVA